MRSIGNVFFLLTYSLPVFLRAYTITTTSRKQCHHIRFHSSHSLYSLGSDKDAEGDSFQPIIAPNLRLPAILTKQRNTNEFQSALDLNWVQDVSQIPLYWSSCESLMYAVDIGTVLHAANI